MKRNILIFIMVATTSAVLMLLSCKKEEKNTSTLCPGGKVCKSEHLNNNYPTTFGKGMLGTYTLKCWSFTPVPAEMPFKPDETAEFELGEDNSLTVRYKGQCLTLTNPFKFSEADQSIVFRDNCVFNVLFIVNRIMNAGGSYDQRLRNIEIRQIFESSWSSQLGFFQF